MGKTNIKNGMYIFTVYFCRKLCKSYDIALKTEELLAHLISKAQWKNAQ